MRLNIPDEAIWLGVGYFARKVTEGLSNAEFRQHINIKQKIKDEEDNRPINIMGDLI